jgi:cytochrome d ubiquinol oxidase subunit II
VLLETIGPVWDGNEVWLLTAGGATFAAFPHWYATMFSGLYLPLLIILVALIVRALGFDYRGKVDDPTWRKALGQSPSSFGSVGPRPALGSRADQRRDGPADRRPPRSTPATCSRCSTRSGLLGGLTTVALFLTHGAIFIALKTGG